MFDFGSDPSYLISFKLYNMVNLICKWKNKHYIITNYDKKIRFKLLSHR